MTNSTLQPALYLVPTPIGNLEDITIRAKRILEQADIIACEDTRHTGMLLKLLEIKAKSLTSYHDHNESEKSRYIADEILSGKSCALVSDAGSPAISDPGYRLVAKCVEMGVLVIPLPGPTAFVPALTASGLKVNEFTFVGFPPQKKGRQTFLKRIVEKTETIVLYESMHRVERLIAELNELGCQERNICIAREISKLYEEFIRCKVGDAKDLLASHKNLKGEFVVVLEGKSSND